MMLLQLWTADDEGRHAEDFLGEVRVDDDEWANAQDCAGDAYELITDLAAEVNDG